MNGRGRRSLFGGNPNTSSASSPSRRHKPDYLILILTALLLTIGLVVVYSISPGLAASQGISQNYFITKQLIDVGLGLTAFLIAAYLPAKFWLKTALPLALAALICSVAVMFMPVDEIYRAHRWIRVGDFSFQVAELIKFALLVWVAGFLTARWRSGQLRDFSATFRPLLILLLAVSIVVARLQSDLGSAGVIIAMIVIMAFATGVPLKRVVLLGGLVLLIFSLAILTTGYRRDRLTSFLNPQDNCLDTSYQACQALISVGSGGLFGLGLGYSVQAYGYLPEASDDSIFAIIAEKFGFVGTVIIILIYGAFITRLKHIIERTNDQFSRLLVVGILAWLSTQMIINVGAMLGLLPIKGITLPLISQGGTSLLFLMAALGLVFQISRYTSYNVTEPSGAGAENNNRFDGRRVRRSYNASFVTRPRT